MRAAIGLLIFCLAVFGQSAQSPVPGTPSADVKDPVYICPMDPNMRSNTPGKCPKCGMMMVAGIPDSAEFHMHVSAVPSPLKARQPERIAFEVFDPWKDLPVSNFQIVHEKLFHAFFISDDLQFFVHDHPIWDKDKNSFFYDITFPKPGTYRVLGDFYPDGATPQLIAQTLIVPGAAPPKVALTRDYAAKKAANLQVEIETVPPQPLAGQDTQLRFHLNPGDGLEKYLGVWGHMLSASDDLIDLVHQHPFIADGGADIQFNMVFARPRTYRVWVQFQRNGVVNTAHFDIPVKPLE
jgi:hypothetical protein